MDFLVTGGAEGNQVGLGIVSQSASWFDVVDLEVGTPTAELAAPAVPLQHLVAEVAVRVRIEAEPEPAREQESHEAFYSCSRNCFCCAGGRN